MRTPIMTAAEGKSEVFDLLLSNNADTTLVGDNGNTLLHLACLGGSKHIVERLVTPANVNSRGYNGVTPIMAAFLMGQIKIFELVYEKGADLSYLTSDMIDVLVVAQRAGKTNAVKYLKSLLKR